MTDYTDLIARLRANNTWYDTEAADALEEQAARIAELEQIVLRIIEHDEHDENKISGFQQWEALVDDARASLDNKKSDELVVKLRTKGKWTSDKVWESDPDCTAAADALEERDRRIAELQTQEAFCKEFCNEERTLRARIVELEAALKDLIEDHEYLTRTDKEDDNLARQAARAALEKKND